MSQVFPPAFLSPLISLPWKITFPYPKTKKGLKKYEFLHHFMLPYQRKVIREGEGKADGNVLIIKEFKDSWLLFPTLILLKGKVHKPHTETLAPYDPPPQNCSHFQYLCGVHIFYHLYIYSILKQIIYIY